MTELPDLWIEDWVFFAFPLLGTDASEDEVLDMLSSSLGTSTGMLGEWLRFFILRRRKCTSWSISAKTQISSRTFSSIDEVIDLHFNNNLPFTQLRLNPRKGNVLAVVSRSSTSNDEKSLTKVFLREVEWSWTIYSKKMLMCEASRMLYLLERVDQKKSEHWIIRKNRLKFMNLKRWRPCVSTTIIYQKTSRRHDVVLQKCGCRGNHLPSFACSLSLSDVVWTLLILKTDLSSVLTPSEKFTSNKISYWRIRFTWQKVYCVSKFCQNGTQAK